MISIMNEVEDTFDKLKAGAKAVAKKVAHPERDLVTQYEEERGKQNLDNELNSDASSKDPISSEDA